MTPFLMEKPPEPVEKLREPAQVAEDWPDRDATVSVDSLSKSSIETRFKFPETADEEKAPEEPEEPLHLTVSQNSGERESGRLKASFAALANLRRNQDAATWIETAAILKRDAIRLRTSPFARHADVLLALADALTFTDPDKADDQSMAVFERSLGVLSEPFVNEPAEEALLVDLMTQGWNLAPSVDPAGYPA